MVVEGRSRPDSASSASQRIRWPKPAALMVLIVVLVPAVATAGHMAGWTHDHSAAGVPYKPNGYNDLVRVFGQPCNDRANDARTWFPHVWGRWQGGYVNYHPYIHRNVSHNIRGHVAAAHRDGAWDWGQYGYFCRQKTGSSGWSTHSFGAAIDTNTARNPYGQCYWNGIGANGVNYGMYLPDVWRTVPRTQLQVGEGLVRSPPLPVRHGLLRKDER